MSENILITSGKGGVGKTTFAINFGLMLAKKGKRVVLLDFDFGLNNLDVVGNIENLVVFDLLDIVSGCCRVKQALVKSPYSENLYILPTTHSLSKSDNDIDFSYIFNQLNVSFDYVIVDSPAGIDLGFHRAVSCCNKAIVITTPHLSSIRDASKVIAILKSYNLESLKVAINRVRGDLVLQGEMYSVEVIENILNVEILGIIPESDSFNNGVIDIPKSESEKAYKIIADNFLNNDNKIYDYLKRYKGFFGSIRKELKKRL